MTACRVLSIKMSDDDDFLSPIMGNLSVQPGHRRHARVAMSAESGSSSPSLSPLHKSQRSSSIDSSSSPPRSMSSLGILSSPSRSTPGSTLANAIDPVRPAVVTEFICTSRLAAAANLYEANSSDKKTCTDLLKAVTNVMTAEHWFAADPSRGQCPPSLAGQKIGEVKVSYTPRHAIPNLQRYACCASTARWSSSVERACVAVIIAVDEVFRLDLDDDAVLAIAEA